MSSKKRSLPKPPPSGSKSSSSRRPHQDARPSASKASAASGSKVKVIVRVRPLNDREVKLGSESVVAMKGQKTIITNPAENTPKGFYFDKSLWSANTADDHFIGQKEAYNLIGTDALENAFEGYNACIFAYGQTGSGKTYTMMGYDEEKGVIPRLCDDIFDRIQANTNPHLTYKVEVSYLEIYNEAVQDLLGNQKSRKNLRVREHPALGPYVEGLSKLAVTTYSAVNTLLVAGNKARTTASTLMNDRSSRSHAVFTLTLTQAQYDEATKQTGEKVSKISLVDLAGSERFSKTGTTGDRLKEGANINKSLSTLGLVISALADQSRGKSKFVPYRDSTLTWLLKDNLGGNSKTVMVATISPSGDNYDESLSTLYYAHRAKSIVNHAIINEDPTAKIIRELREELELLRAGVGVDKALENAKELENLRSQLAQTETLIQEMTMSWEEKLKNTEAIVKEKEKLLEERGASVQGEGQHGLKVEVKLPHMIGLVADPFAGGITIYSFSEGLTRIGTDGQTPPNDIILSFADAAAFHCEITHKIELNRDENVLQEVVTLIPKDGECAVDGEIVSGPTSLYHGSTIILGESAMYRFNHPTEAERMRRSAPKQAQEQLTRAPTHMTSNPIAKKREEEYQRQRDELLKQQEEMTQQMRAQYEEEHRKELEQLRLQREATEAEKLKFEEAEARAEKERIEQEIEAEELRLRLAEKAELRMHEEAARAEEERAHRLALEQMSAERERLGQEKASQLEELQQLALAQHAHSQQLLQMQEAATNKVEERQRALEQQEQLRSEVQHELQNKDALLEEQKQRQAQAEQELLATRAALEAEQERLQQIRKEAEDERLRIEEEKLRLEMEAQEQYMKLNMEMTNQWEETEGMLRKQKEVEERVRREMEEAARAKIKREMELEQDGQRKLEEARAISKRERALDTLVALTGLSRKRCFDAYQKADHNADMAAAELFRQMDQEQTDRQTAESLRLAQQLASNPEILPPLPEQVIAQCGLCQQNVVASECFGLDCCEHKFHRTCLIVYVQTEVGNVSNPIHCPVDTCAKTLTPSDITSHVDQETYESYISDCTASVIDNNANMRWCETPGCAYAFEYVEGRDSSNFRCPSCNKAYCLRCHTSAHPTGVSCLDYQNNPFLQAAPASTSPEGALSRSPSLARRMMQGAHRLADRMSPATVRRNNNHHA